MRIDVVDGRLAGLQRHLHAAHRAFARGLHHVVAIGSSAVPGDLGIDPGATCFRVLELFQHQHAGAAGAQEAIYSLLMMNNGFICESANIQELDPAFADMPIVRERKDNATLGAVLSNSFGFGGTNASVVFKRLDA